MFETLSGTKERQGREKEKEEGREDGKKKERLQEVDLRYYRNVKQEPSMVVHAFNFRTWEAAAGRFL